MIALTNNSQNQNWANNTSVMNSSEIFTPKQGGAYLNEFTLFVAYYNLIPNCIDENNIDCKKAIIWFNNCYSSKINDCYYYKASFKNKTNNNDTFYFLDVDLLIYFDLHFNLVRILFNKTEFSKVEEIIANLQKFQKRKAKEKPEIQLLVNTSRGIDTKSLEIKRPKLGIEENYNEDFRNIHKTIIQRLSKKNDKGLVLLHGKPGTGKTTYIRYLISSLKKDVIFLPPNMASAITNPNLISILIDNPNSIFVIEDAENIIADRERNGNSPVSALLNISDGLLADCLNVQIICSFNTDISKIDSALLRKGRLIAKYEFKELEVEKAQFLSNKLGFNNLITKPMSLASIYNQEETDFQEQDNSVKIGFHTNRINQ